jgi:hypothetical protein
MRKTLAAIISKLIQPEEGDDSFAIFDPTGQFDEERNDRAGIARALNAAFLIALAGNEHPASERAKSFLTRMAGISDWAEVAKFYLNGISSIHEEIESVCQRDPDFADRLNSLSHWVSNKTNMRKTGETIEKIWSVFFPEAAGMRANQPERVEALRAKRTIKITELNTDPITDPARQIIFTSNVLLGLPPASKSPNELPLSNELKEKILQVTLEPQLYWYDHPIQIGVEPEKNEALYGLRGLQEALSFERDRGNITDDTKLTCILSVSVTHRGLQKIAKRYLEEEFAHCRDLKNIEVYVFTEADAQRIIGEILAPAAWHYLQHEKARNLPGVFGVDGEYGRHYSFLKAIAAFWKIFIRPEIKATFKIDLDQVFPQKELVEQTGASAFEHFTTPLWGAKGVDSNGHPVELGMIAGALVNARDIEKSLFTPDVVFPNRALSPDEYIFFSELPQALSTQAEMMTRYATGKPDGKRACIQRLHVTGGTNGILVESLRRHRPFTPSFISRAEDQAYILSVFPKPGARLAYAHKDGLIMRHDKEAFAQEAIQSAYVGKLVGDYIRILYFSAYARLLANDIAKLKEIVDPFTGCFISKIPNVVVHLRFSLKAASFFSMGKSEQGMEFIRIGARRIAKALDFVRGENSLLAQQYEKECLGWNLYYDTLAAVEEALKTGDAFAPDLCRKAQHLIAQCAIRFRSV